MTAWTGSTASNSIINFSDDIKVVGLITNNDETAYREVRALAEWCQENNLSLNVNKIKELIVDFRRQQREHAPIHIDTAEVEKLNSLKLFSIHITDNLKWSTHTGITAPLQPQEAEEIWLGPQDSQLCICKSL